MAGLPAIILFGFSSLIWVLKNRHIRTIWILTLTSFFIAWIATIVLTQFLPSEITISSWEPQSIFLSGLRFEIDSLTVPLVSASLTLGLVIALTFEHKQHTFRPFDLFSLCFLGGTGLLTIISGNFITFCLSWVLWEIAIIFIQSIGDASVFAFGATPNRMFQRLISVPLVLAIGIIIDRGGNGTEAISEQAINWAFLLGIIVVFVRTDLLQNPLSHWSDASHAQSNEIWIQGISVASGFALLGRTLKYSSPADSNTLFVGLGFILCIIGILRLLVLSDIGSNVASIALTLLGVGVLIEPIGLVFQGEILLLICSIMLLVFSSMSMPGDKRLWSLIAVLAASSLVIGLPGSIGGVVLKAVVETLLSKNGIFIGTISIISLLAIALNLIRSPAMNLRSNKPSQEESNLSAIISTSLLLLTGMIMGLLHGATFSPGSVGIFIASAVLLGITTYSIVAKGVSFKTSLTLTPPKWSIDAMESVWTGLSTTVGTIIQATARVFEGRAGLLWVYVIVQFILVAVGITE